MPVMKTIAVPTDFSELSKVAIAYALGLAKRIEARVIIVSVISGEASSEALASWKMFEQKMLKAAQEDGDRLLKEFKSEKGNVEVWYRSILGFPVVDKIEEFVVKNKVDLIVMGSKGASGLKKIMMGSNAAAVINNSSVPVIVVPEEARFRNLKKLIYATDAKNFSEEVKSIAAFSERVGASMEVLHVIPANGQKKSVMTKTGISKEKLVELVKYPKVHLHVLHNDNVAKGVDDFVESQKGDMLALFTHRLGFNEKVLGKSVTRKLAFHNHVPLITFNRSSGKGFA